MFAGEVEGREPVAASRFLADRTGLSRTAVKDAMLKGACLVRRSGSFARLRRAGSLLLPGQRVTLHYDPALLAREPPQAEEIGRESGFTVWNKPAGLLSQGNEWGDHCSLLRQVELRLRPDRLTPWLVHRLDREVAGLVLLATSRQDAARLSGLFRRGEVEKTYHARVLGNLERSMGAAGTMDGDLDGKPCATGFRVIGYDADTDATGLELRLVTGRKHQIRRHLDRAGFPVLGDPRYGTGNKRAGGIRLAATGLAFTDPRTGRTRAYRIPCPYEDRSSG